MSKPKFKVAVCGGGVGGLTFAVAISRYPDIEVEIFEAASEFSPIGAGIGVWPRVWKALASLGLEDLTVYASTQPSDDPVCTVEFRKSDQSNGYPFCKIITNGPLLFFYRADFHAALVKHLPPSCPIQYAKRLQSYSRLESGEIELAFEDGTTSKCDLLIGADGIKSAVRRTFLHEQAQEASREGRTADADNLLAAVHPIWTGTLAYRALVPVESLQNYVIHEYGTQYLGKNWAIMTYPIARGTLVNISAYHINDALAGTAYDGPWIEDARKEELLHTFSHWEPAFMELIQGINKPTKWAIHTVKPLHSFVSDRVALLGDAAHAMAPHQGAGAGQAIEDGCVLATLLGHHLTMRETLPHALHTYDALRRPFVQSIARLSLETGRYLGLTHEDFVIDECKFDMEKELLKDMGEAIISKWQWAWSTSLDDMIREGISILEA